MTRAAEEPHNSANDVDPKRKMLHARLARDPEFIRESEELARRISAKERSPVSAPASELRERFRGRRLPQVRPGEPR
jgi:hypothetical protein